MSEILNDLKKYADHRGFPEELPNFNTTASRAVGEIVRLRAKLAKATAVPIKAPGNDQLSNLWNAIVENTKGDGFWIGEILLTTLEREVGFNPAALKDVQS